MRPVLIDTNAYSAFMLGAADVVDVVPMPTSCT